MSIMYNACLVQVLVNCFVITGKTIEVSNLQHYNHNRRMRILLTLSFKHVIPFQNSKLNHYIEAKLGLLNKKTNIQTS